MTMNQSRNISQDEISGNHHLSSRQNHHTELSQKGKNASSAVPQPRFATNFPTNTNFTITLNNDEGSISEGSLEDEVNSLEEEIKKPVPVNPRMSKLKTLVADRNMLKPKPDKSSSKKKRFQSRGSKNSGYSKIEVEYVINDIIE